MHDFPLKKVYSLIWKHKHYYLHDLYCCDDSLIVYLRGMAPVTIRIYEFRNGSSVEEEYAELASSTYKTRREYYLDNLHGSGKIDYQGLVLKKDGVVSKQGKTYYFGELYVRHNILMKRARLSLFDKPICRLDTDPDVVQDVFDWSQGK